MSPGPHDRLGQREQPVQHRNGHRRRRRHAEGAQAERGGRLSRSPAAEAHRQGGHQEGRHCRDRVDPEGLVEAQCPAGAGQRCDGERLHQRRAERLPDVLLLRVRPMRQPRQPRAPVSLLPWRRAQATRNRQGRCRGKQQGKRGKEEGGRGQGRQAERCEPATRPPGHAPGGRRGAEHHEHPQAAHAVQQHRQARFERLLPARLQRHRPIQVASHHRARKQRVDGNTLEVGDGGPAGAHRMAEPAHQRAPAQGRHEVGAYRSRESGEQPGRIGLADPLEHRAPVRDPQHREQQEWRESEPRPAGQARSSRHQRAASASRSASGSRRWYCAPPAPSW